MLITCAVLAVRYEFGPDYFNYRGIFEGLQGSDVNSYTGKGQSAEKPFLVLLSLFPSFTAFVVFLTAILFAANTFIINKYVNPRYFWIAVLFMFLEPTFLLLELVAMRAAIAAVLFIIAFEQLINGRRLLYVGIILFASLFHTSAVVLVLLALLNTKNRSVLFTTWLPFVCLILALFSVVLGVNFVVVGFVDFAVDTVEEMNRYQGYVENVGSVSQSVNTILFRLLTFLIMLYLTRAGASEKDPKYVLIYKIGVIAILIQLIFGQSLIGDRYLMVFNILYICAITRSCMSKQFIDKRIVLLIIAIISSYMLYQKMGRDYNESYLVFHTIFSAPYIP